LTDTTQEEQNAGGQASLWQPLRIRTFRNLLLADVVSDIGTFMQNVGASWLMVSLNAGPIYVALTQTAASLPYFLLALPAGSAGDIVDRRRLVLFTESWMMGVALILALLTIGGLMSPWLLLALTFALSAGDAFETPTWRAILPEIVPKEDIAPASALNGIEFNLARAVGPAIAGVVIATAGVAAAFFVNFLSFCGVILVVARWKRPVQRQTSPPETLTGATVAGIRYVRHSPAILSVVVRASIVMFFSSALFALLPTVSRSVHDTAAGYGLLLGCFGVGAIGGAFIMQLARTRWSNEVIVSAATAILGLVIVSIGTLHSLLTLTPVMLLGGAAWVNFISLISALIQNLAPDWVRARVLAIFILIYQGSFALGSAAWGTVAQGKGIRSALVYAGIGTIGSLAFLLFVKLPDSAADLTPWNHWRMPVVIKGFESEIQQGQVLVTIKYSVIREQEAEFVETIHEYGRIRRRDGAYRWGIYRDTEVADRYLEIFLVNSWAEHLRQHARRTRADEEVEQRLYGYVSGQPEVHHLVYAHSKEP